METLTWISLSWFLGYCISMYLSWPRFIENEDNIPESAHNVILVIVMIICVVIWPLLFLPTSLFKHEDKP